MQLEEVPDDVLYNHILSYFHIEEVFVFSGISKNIRMRMKNYLGQRNMKSLVISRCQERKKQKQQFFYNFIYKISGDILFSPISMARIFCYIDDKFHNRTFTTNILKWDKYLNNENKQIWTYDHRVFYKYCLEEIKYHYDRFL